MSPEGRGVVSAGVVLVVSIALFLLGFLLIVLYAFSMSGPHLRYLSVGLLTACAALLAGGLAGLVVGVPRDVSSGALRATTSRSSPADNSRNGAGKSASPAAEQGTPPPAFEPSTNLAEISDWLTKLLLGAGLVGLTHLGQPLARLVDAVARGLAPVLPGGKLTGAAVIIAATILIAYVVLGFLEGYLATTLWYGKRLQAMFDTGQAGPPADKTPPSAPKASASRARDTTQLKARLDQQVGLLGSEHPDTMRTRGNLAWQTTLSGALGKARKQWARLLDDQRRVLGPDHPDVLRTRSQLALVTGQLGDADAARGQFGPLLDDQRRVLGPDHPDVLRTHGSLAWVTNEAGDTDAAQGLYVQLLRDQVRVLGPDHPDVLRTRSQLAEVTGQAGDAAAARDLFEQLLRDQVRLLGRDHPDTVQTQWNVAEWNKAATPAPWRAGSSPD